jgi:hypothetical protein
MAENVAKLNVIANAQCGGLIEGMKQSTAAIEKFHQANGRAAAAFQIGSKAASDYGRKLQGFGYQFQDAMVQISGGQNIANAITAQGSQFLGMFGPKGAIVGAVLATGGLVYNLLNTSMSTEKAEKEAKKLEAEYKKVQDRLIEVRRAWEEIDALHSQAVRTKSPRTEAETKTYRQGLVGEAMPALLNAQRDAEGRMGIALARGNPEEARRQEDIMLAAAKQYAEVRNEVANIDAGIADIHLKQSLELDRQSHEDEDAMKNKWRLMDKQADAILDQLDGTRKLKREAEEIAGLPKELLNADQKAQALANLVGPASIPQAMQVNAGASALGGTYGDGAAVLDIQREVLKVAQQQRDALNRMIQMWSTGSN